MISDTPAPSGASQSGKPREDFEQTKRRSAEEIEAAKSEARNAAETVRDSASDLSRRAREKAREEGERGKENVAGGLDDFAAAVRKASDELGSRDQSMASQLVREVAGGLEHASKTIHGKDVGELTQSVARFARERPATFLVGAALAGLALGRFARSSNEHDEGDYADGSNGFSPSGSERDGAPGSRSGTLPSDYRSSYSGQPRPSESAFPDSHDPLTGASRPGAGSVGGAGVAPQDPLSSGTNATSPSSARPTPSVIDPTKGGNNER